MSVPTSEVFYGKPAAAAAATPPAAVPAPAAGAAPPKSGADGKTPPAVDASTEPTKSTEEVLFGGEETIARDFEPYIKTEIDGIAADSMMAPEQRAEFLQETGQIFRDLAVSPSDSQQWMGLYAQTIRSPPSAETEAQWTREAMLAVNSKYGNEEAHRRLTQVRDFLALPQNATLHNELHASRLACHPKVVAGLCELADKLVVRKR